MCIRGVGSKRVSSDEFALQGNSSLTTRTDAGCGSGWVRVFAGCSAVCTPSESTLDVTAQNACSLLERRVALELDGVHHLEGILGMLVGVLRRVGIISLHTVGHSISDWNEVIPLSSRAIARRHHEDGDKEDEVSHDTIPPAHVS